MSSTTLKSAFILAGAVVFLLFILSAYSSVEPLYIAKVKSEFAAQPLTPVEILTEADIAHLPSPVRKYIAYTGAIGKSKLQNIRVRLDAEMRKNPDSSPMMSDIEQYNFFGTPARIFYLKASMYWIPARVLHAYVHEQATMQVRLASLFNVVDLSGPELSSTETVTLLNDMCVFAPASLIDKHLTWEELDSLRTKVVFENGPYKVSAIVYFNNSGELVNFESDDREALQDDGTLKKMKWSTPLRDYKEINGRKIFTYGEAIYRYPEGEFAYGKFTLKDIRYNVEGFE